MESLAVAPAPSMGQQQEQQASSTRKRRRIVSAVKKACLNCKESHQACEENVRPCKRCTQLGIGHLCFDPPERKRGRPRKRIYQLSTVQASLFLGGNGPTQESVPQNSAQPNPSIQLTALATILANSNGNNSPRTSFFVPMSRTDTSSSSSAQEVESSPPALHSYNGSSAAAAPAPPPPTTTTTTTASTPVSFPSSSMVHSESSSTSSPSPIMASDIADFFTIDTSAFLDSTPVVGDPIIPGNTISSSWCPKDPFDTVQLSPKREVFGDDDYSNPQYLQFVKTLSAENRKLRFEMDRMRQELAVLRRETGSSAESTQKSDFNESSPSLAVWDGHDLPFRLSAYNDTFRGLFSSFSQFELQEASWDKLVHPKMMDATYRCWQWVCSNHITHSQKRHVVFKQKDGRNLYTTVDLLFTYSKDRTQPVTMVTNIHPISKGKFLESVSNRSSFGYGSTKNTDSAGSLSSLFDPSDNESLEEVLNRILCNTARFPPTISFQEE